MSMKKKIIFFIIIKIIVLVLLGLLGWWYYNTYIKKSEVHAVPVYAGSSMWGQAEKLT